MTPPRASTAAIIEVVVLGVALLLPLLYAMLAVFEVQRASYAATTAVREAGRAILNHLGLEEKDRLKPSIKTGTMIKDARLKCPQLVCVLADHKKYVEYHHRILAEIDRHIPVGQERDSRGLIPTNQLNN